MPKASPALTTFDAGELSPRLFGRTDLAKYFNGCAKLRNFLPLVQGPLVRRGGTRYVVPVKWAAERCWLVRFQVSETITYMLEFGPGYIRFLADRGQLVSGGAPVEVATPYTAADLTAADGTCGIHVTQSADTLYIFHRRHQPRKLLRLAADAFSLGLADLQEGPFQDVNKDDAIKVSASAVTGTVTLTATGAVFQAADVGTLLYLESADYSSVRPWATQQEVSVGERRRVDYRVYQCTATGSSSGDEPAVTGTTTPTHTEGRAWDGDGVDVEDDQLGPIGVEWEFLHASYGIVRIVGVAGPSSATVDVVKRLPDDLVPGAPASVVTRAIATVEVGSAGRSRITSPGHGFLDGHTVAISGTVLQSLIDPPAGNRTIDGAYTVQDATGDWFEVATPFPDDYAYSPTAVGTVSRSIPAGPSNPTSKWARALFSDVEGWPEHGVFWRERLVLARDRTLALSVVGDFENFARRIDGEVVADAAIVRTLNARRINRIVWLVESDELLVGTNGDEWVVGPIQGSEAVGPSNIRAARRTANGSRQIQPEPVGTRVLFVQKSGRKVRDYVYDYTSDNFESTDTTKLADHITRGGVVDMTYQQEPDSILWCARADGTLIGLTYDREVGRSDVYGWHPHPMVNGWVEAVEAMPAPDGGTDDLWMIVRREVNGQVQRYVEWLVPPLADEQDAREAFYVDCGATYRGSAATVISGLGHLEGQTVDILADGATHPRRVVAGGQITLQVAASVVHVGLPAPCEAWTMPLEAGAADGTAQGKIKRITNVVMRMLRTLGGKFGPVTGDPQEIQFRRPANPMDQAPPLFTGDTDSLAWPAGYERQAQARYINDQPLPVTLLAIYPNVTTQDGR